MMRRILILAFVFLCSSPVEAKVYRVGGKPDPLILESKNMGGRRFHMLGSISVSGFSRKEVLQKLKDKAREFSADAVLGVKFSESDSVTMALPFRNPNRSGIKSSQIYPTIAQITAEGLLVRFSDQGAKSVNKKSVIPIVE